MKDTIAALLLALVLPACSNQPPTIQRTDVLVHIKLVDHIDYKGHQAYGLTTCGGPVCEVQILRDRYPFCLLHEIRHVIEGDWHEGRETTWDCD